MFIPASEKEIANQLTTLGQVSSRPWALIGSLLDQAERLGVWQGEARSFTEWMRRVALSLDLRESSVWRYLRATRIYQELRADLATRGHSLPDLQSLPKRVSAENLELFSKLRRVAPQEKMDEIALRLIAGNIVRNELRTLWYDYRPAMAGRTAQGRGVGSPVVDHAKPGTANSLLEAEVFSILRTGWQGWTHGTPLNVNELFTHVALPLAANCIDKFWTIDAVVVLRRAANGPIELHGIEVRTPRILSPRDFYLFDKSKALFDYMWIASNRTDFVLNDTSEIEHVGLLLIESGQMIVARPATKRADSGTRSGDLAKCLLLTALHHS